MKDWFAALEERERLLVTVAAAFLVFAVLYLAVWLPLDRGQKSLETSVNTWRDSISELRLLKGSTVPAEGGQEIPGDLNQSLVVIVDNTLRQRALYNALKRSQPTAANGIRVEFENAAFDDLVLWLGDLAGRYGLQVQSGSFSGTSGQRDGRVNATLTLER